MVEEKDEVVKEEPIEDALQKAESLAKRIEDANKRSEEILSRALLSGHAVAGQVQAKPAEETPKEYATRIMRGGK